MTERLLLTVTLIFSISVCAAAAQIPADSETIVFRPDNSEIINWMKQAARIPAAQQNEKAAAALKGISGAGSKTPRSDFQLCTGLAYLGNITAQRCVGYAYEKGFGVVDDMLEAYVWFALACGGDKESESDFARVLLALNSAYPAPSEEELEKMTSEQKEKIAEFQKQIK